MAKLKKKLKDVTGDGKFTYADVLKMRGVKPKGKKKSMDVGGRLGYYTKRMAPFLVGNPLYSDKSVRITDDYLDRIDDVYGPYKGDDRHIDAYSGRFRSIDPLGNRAKEMALADREYVGGLKEQPFIERKADILRERDLRGLMEPMRLNLPEDMKPMQSRKPGEIMGYGGKVKMLKGGKVEYGMGGKTMEYGLGGAVLAGINAIKNKEGLIGGIKNVAKAYATPGSGIAQGAKLAGGMLANANNPALAGIGKVAGMASNFMPGGAGVAGLAGNVMQNMGGGSGMASVMQPLQGLFQQKHGGYVSKHRLLRG